MNTITKQHFALIIKYAGISFITGGLSHGFFSGKRQILTSLFGVVLFIVGTLLERDDSTKQYFQTILYSSLFAVGLGALTGGLQHFPDSPERSIWIVPMGFLLSFYAYTLLEQVSILKRKNILYTMIGMSIFVLISIGLYFVVTQGYIAPQDSHHSADTYSVDIVNADSEIYGNTGNKSVENHVDGDEHTDH